MSVVVEKNLDPFIIRDADNDLLRLSVNGESRLVIFPQLSPSHYDMGVYYSASGISEIIDDTLEDVWAYADEYGRVLLVSTYAITIQETPCSKLLGFEPGYYPAEATGSE